MCNGEMLAIEPCVVVAQTARRENSCALVCQTCPATTEILSNHRLMEFEGVQLDNLYEPFPGDEWTHREMSLRTASPLSSRES